MVLMSPSSFEGFAVKCDATGMGVSAIETKAKVICQKTVEEVTQENEFKNLGILFTRGRFRQIGVMLAVKWTLYWTAVVRVR